MFIFWEKSIKIIVIALDFFPQKHALSLAPWRPHDINFMGLRFLFIREFSICTSPIKLLVDHVSFEWGGGGG